ncbi:DUF1697 domain-containing protein [Deinococcus cellulosilyticus]|uniref:DUF1697 domain-containing protein n=1 Tax=Deinococcus cellulosilyticus (strain DSM 18568 / NBRC 106333 / KACC 11606 / 5516J-15) TaxID=1223518 RepID=A0A511N434_DEIC1|nr:DUF1697 domain-containing protein [Deinococcus cellulosilyticus]GEM47228.1 hypothetical protein DC3_28630 [Deinococcus cellulosilyticus NBRC 106333 = KACC 11606]
MGHDKKRKDWGHQWQPQRQSGNVTLKHSGTAEALVQQVRQVIEAHFGFEVGVVVRDAGDWQQVVQQNPFLDQTEHLHVAFLGNTPSDSQLKALQEAPIGEDRWGLKGDNLYLFYPDGTAGALLTHAVLEKKLKVSATVRNWRTVLKIRDMLLES